MANSKLTLSIEPEFIEMAKNYASANNTSVSKLFKDFIKDIAKKREVNDPLPGKLRNMEVPEDIKSLTGILEGKYPACTGYENMGYEYFKGKYKL